MIPQLVEKSNADIIASINKVTATNDKISYECKELSDENEALLAENEDLREKLKLAEAREEALASLLRGKLEK